MSGYRLYTFAERPDRAREAIRLQASVWPEIMMHDPVADELFHHLWEGLGAYQQMLCDERDAIVAVGLSIPLVWDPSRELPDAGWDWVMRKGVEDHLAGRPVTAVSAVSAAVLAGNQGKGLSAEVVRGMRAIGRRRGLRWLIAPVRPSQKSQYPLAPMERYLRWRNADGLPFDAWVRVHARLGARIDRVAARSMTITGSVAEWERWARMAFPETGSYVVPGALVPVEIDHERDVGTYVEPNVWMVHEVG